jgi:hypothetical protein
MRSPHGQPKSNIGPGLDMEVDVRCMGDKIECLPTAAAAVARGRREERFSACVNISRTNSSTYCFFSRRILQTPPYLEAERSALRYLRAGSTGRAILGSVRPLPSKIAVRPQRDQGPRRIG